MRIVSVNDKSGFVSQALGISSLIVLMVAGTVAAGTNAEVLERIRPIGMVNLIPSAVPSEVAAVPVMAIPKEDENSPGRQIYTKVCVACHATGVSNAPRLGNKADWEPRTGKGLDALLQSALRGLPGTAMMPKGTCATCSDEDIRLAVEYMVSRVKPVPVAAPASAAQPEPAPAPVVEAPPAAPPVDGGKVYAKVCVACHAVGVSNAPKLGDKAAWAPRIAKGPDALLQSALHGVKGTAMMPRGTCASCSDAELKAAMEYMVSQAQ